MKELEKILGENTLQKIGETCETLLRESYQEYAQIESKGYIEVKMGDAVTEAAVSILEDFGFLSRAGYWHSGILGTYKITQKGMDIFDAYFRKEGEFFSPIEKLCAIVESENDRNSRLLPH